MKEQLRNQIQLSAWSEWERAEECYLCRQQLHRKCDGDLGKGIYVEFMI